MTVTRSLIDTLRKELREAQSELAQVTKNLEASGQRNTELHEENARLKQLMRNAATILRLPEEKTFKTYDHPGVCGLCGSFTCSGTCFK